MKLPATRFMWSNRASLITGCRHLSCRSSLAYECVPKPSGDCRADFAQRLFFCGRDFSGRIAPPSELAETVQYLASSGAGFVTGQVIQVDGGRSVIDPIAVPVY